MKYQCVRRDEVKTLSREHQYVFLRQIEDEENENGFSCEVDCCRLFEMGSLKTGERSPLILTDLVHAYNLCFAHKIPTPT